MVRIYNLASSTSATNSPVVARPSFAPIFHMSYHHPYPNDYPGEDVDPSNSVQFQIPQFMFNGPPILAPGGGAEVLFNASNTGTSWFTNNVFDTEAPTDP